MAQDTLETLRTVLSARYRVERLLGSGGMATVYLAHDLKHDRPVAIKVLRPELAAVLGPERFLREIQIAAKLTHPHILPLHDSGEADGLLYYVMPYVAGESLLDRVTREKQLPVDDAVRITREVASALAYAHARGIIHRDIKPGNILLSDGSAMVADFGLARAISRAQTTVSLTRSGITIGTPAYMSPEQAGGEAELDGRSDIYALGCVLYELLAGDPPFTASTPTAMLARHVGAKVVPLRTIRAAVPVEVEKAVLKALEKVPADRFKTAEQFAAALAGSGRARPLPKWVTYGAVGMAVVAVGFALWRSTRIAGSGPTFTADTTLYAVLPFEFLGTAPKALFVEQSIHDALAQWTGIAVVDHFQIEDALAQLGTPTRLSLADAQRLARMVAAGRYLRGDVSRTGDSLRIHAGLWDAVAGRGLLGEATVKVRADQVVGDSAVSDLVGHLLLPLAGPAERRMLSGGSRSLPARRAMTLGEAHLREWDLERADSAFSIAVRLDPDYAEAALWLGVVRAWGLLDPSHWKFAAERAAAQRTRLSERDRGLSDAILAQSRDDYASACSIWRGLGTKRPYDFAAWYGLATCLHADPAVIRDSRSPSGWRYRSSYQEVVRAYQRAFELLPSIHRAFRSGAYARVRDLLFTSSDRLRPGRALAPDTVVFVAHPAWEGDSLVFIPFPFADIAAGKPRTIPASMQEAVVHQRQLFRDIATSWTDAFPESADAFEALAVSLELLGDPAALETFRKARQLARTPEERERVATAEFWLRLKLALPDDYKGLEAVRTLGDSLLGPAPKARLSDPEELAPVAAVLGRVQLAAELSGRAAEVGSPPLPRALARAGQALVTYAAFGGPADTLKALERNVESGIRNSLTSSEAALSRRAWLGRAATLAFPDVTLASLTMTAIGLDPLLDAQVAASLRKWETVRSYLASIGVQRSTLSPEEITIDALYSEARLLVMLGDSKAAAEWLDPTLAALHHVAPQTLALVSYAASLVRAMALRAELADRLGDQAGAARWARPVRFLWANADPFLQPILSRMTNLTR